MNLLIIVVNDPKDVEEVLSTLALLDVQGVVAVRSESMLSFLAQEIPLFAGLRTLIETPRSENKTVFGLTENDEILAKLEKRLKRVGVNLQDPGVGYAFLVPVSGWIGNIEEA